MSLADSSLTRSIMRDISKHPVDVSKLDVHVSSGVVYLRGQLEPIRGYHTDVNLDDMLTTIVKCVRQRPDVRDVVSEVIQARASIRSAVKPPKRY
jgi:hypothetical protein